MPPNLRRITLDFETRSSCELKKAGAYKYSRHPSTQATCLSFKERNSQVRLLRFDEVNCAYSELPKNFRLYWEKAITEGALFVAHNALFETLIYKNILVKWLGWPDIPFRQFRCTAAKAAACALPRSLEGAGTALNLTTQKDKMGYVAMMATCKPTKQWNAWKKKFDRGSAEAWEEPPLFLEYDHDPEMWERLYSYCKIDTATEELIDYKLPDLIPSEQEIWFLNQQMNWNGIRVDVKIARKIVDILEADGKKKRKELDALTYGLVTKPGARKAILDFLKEEGVQIEDIRAKTVEDLLSGGHLSPDARRLLEIRKALSKTSTKKYQGMLDRANENDRVCDLTLYHGASTGRDTGTGLQPHNFPRPLIKQKEINEVITLLKTDREDLAEYIEYFYGDVALVFSSLLRAMILPTEGSQLFVADFSKIEVAVLWWLADNHAGLEILRAGKDPYKYMAAANTKRKYEEIKDDDPARQLGKAQILGCGFGMGFLKFKKTALEQYRLTLTTKESRHAVKSYREQNAAVPLLWEAYEQAAIEAIQEKKTVTAGKCKFRVKGGFLWVKLPSGRKLAYRDPRVTLRSREYETIEVHPETGEETLVKRFTDEKETVEFLGLAKDKKTMVRERTWGGTLTENIVQAAARDLMMPAMPRLKKAGYTPLLSVHDEGICERKLGEGNLEEFVKILCEPPIWADTNLPIDAKGFTAMRYRK